MWWPTGRAFLHRQAPHGLVSRQPYLVNHEISMGRFWASLSRIPEKIPLTSNTE